ncbi:MAG: stage VI sporulation protein F [Bacilli bacterium]|nr:stage VI sporulation protein F [Bacilli bacterium]
MLNDNFFKKVEKKTNVNKDAIMNLASKLQNNNLKDEKTLKEVIHELSNMTGRKLSTEQQDNIIKAVLDDNVPKDVDKLVDEHIN